MSNFLNQTRLAGSGDGFSATVDAQFIEDIMHMTLDSAVQYYGGLEFFKECYQPQIHDL